MLGVSSLLGLPTQVVATAASVPDLVAAVRVLPRLSEQLDRIAEGTDALPEMRTAILRLAEDASVLPDVHREIGAMTRATTAMERHTSSISETVPALVTLEESLPGLVPVLGDLTALIERLQGSLGQLERKVHTLADVAEPLQGAAERVGRIADRLPRRRGSSS